MIFLRKGLAEKPAPLSAKVLDELTAKFIKGIPTPSECQVWEKQHVLPGFFAGLYSLKILIVDDNEMNIVMMEKLVKSMGIQQTVKKANSGLAALEILKETRKVEFTDLDLILLDVNMPEETMNGIDFFEFLAKKNQYPDTLIIFATKEDRLGTLMQLRNISNGRYFDYYFKNNVLDSLASKILTAYSLIYLKKHHMTPSPTLLPPHKNGKSPGLSQLMGEAFLSEETIFDQVKIQMLDKQSTDQKLEMVQTLVKDTPSPERSIGVMRRLINENLNESDVRVKEALIHGIGLLLDTHTRTVNKTTVALSESVQKEETFGEQKQEHVEKIRNALFAMLSRFPHHTFEQERLRRLLFGNKTLTENAKKFIVGVLIDYYRKNSDEHGDNIIRGIAKIFMETLTFQENIEEPVKCFVAVRFAEVCYKPYELKRVLWNLRERSKFNPEQNQSPFHKSLGVALELLGKRPGAQDRN